MNKLMYILPFLTITLGYSFPGLETEKGKTCVMKFGEFCEKLPKGIIGMCPGKMTQNQKSMCVVTQAKKKFVLDVCSKELSGRCKKSKENFKSSYLCLVDPKNWKGMSPNCLRILGSGFRHSNSSKEKSI